MLMLTARRGSFFFPPVLQPCWEFSEVTNGRPDQSRACTEVGRSRNHLPLRSSLGPVLLGCDWSGMFCTSGKWLWIERVPNPMPSKECFFFLVFFCKVCGSGQKTSENVDHPDVNRILIWSETAEGPRTNAEGLSSRLEQSLNSHKWIIPLLTLAKSNKY